MPTSRVRKGLNILFAGKNSFHPEKSGVGRVTDTLAKEFLHQGHLVYYLLFDGIGTNREDHSYPAPVFYLPSSRLFSRENEEFYQAFLKEKKIDIVVNQAGDFKETFLFLKTGMSRAKVISALHREPLMGYRHWWSEMSACKDASLLEKIKRVARMALCPFTAGRHIASRKRHFARLLRSDGAIVAPSPGFLPLVDACCPGHRKEIHIIPNPNTFSELQLQIASKAARKKQILYAGPLTREKHVDRVLRIWRRLAHDFPDWNLLLAGKGVPSYEAYLHSLAEGMERVSIRNSSESLALYAESGILCLAANQEGWCMPIAEAMQCGVVPIVFDSFASASELISHGNSGFVIPFGDLKAYERSLRDLMSDAALLSRMSAAAADSVKTYASGAIAARWEALMEEILEKGS